MISISHKTKQFLVLLAKLLIVGGAFYFIYRQLSNNGKLEWSLFLATFNKNTLGIGVAFILGLSALNLYFEILKWKNLATYLHPISTLESTKQVLASLTAGIFTPNGIGEYAGKALFFDKSETKLVILLNGICNGIQMVFTVIFGCLGLLYLNYHYQLLPTPTVFYILLGLTGAVGLLFSIKKITIKGYSIAKLVAKINAIPKEIHRRNILLGCCRYIIFSNQYYFLFLAFDIKLPYLTMMAAISSVYILASSLPSFQFLEFAIKGSIALYIFGVLGINEWLIIFISTMMWILNVVIPVVFGSVYVLNFKTPSISSTTT